MNKIIKKRLISWMLVLAMVFTLPFSGVTVYADTPTVSLSDLSLDTDGKILTASGDYCVDFNYTICNPGSYREFYIDVYYVLMEGSEEVINGCRGFFAEDLEGSDEIELFDILPETEYTMVIKLIEVQGFPEVPEGETSNAEYVLTLDSGLPTLTFTTPEASDASVSVPDGVTYDESTNTITFEGTDSLTSDVVNEAFEAYPSAANVVIIGYTSIVKRRIVSGANCTIKSVVLPR